jgi:hypothetical protein
MKHVFDIPPDQIRRMQSFFPPLHVGNSAVMWRPGDFLAHFPDCKSHAPACMMQFKAAVRDLALPRKVDVSSFTDFPVPPRLRVPF